MFSGLFRFCRSVFFCFVFPWKLSRFLRPSEPQTSFFSGVAFESLFALSGDMAASCSLQNASTTTRFLVGFAVLASILFALSPAVSSLPALSFAAAQVESGVQAAVHVVEGPHAPAVAEEQQITNVRGESPVENSSGGSGSRPAASGAVEPAAMGEPSERGLDGHRPSRGKPESGKQLLERLRRTSTAARGAQTPKAEELKVQEQGLTDDRTIVIRPRAGPREQLKKALRRNLRITRGQWVKTVLWFAISCVQLSAVSALVHVFNAGLQVLLAYAGIGSFLVVAYSVIFGAMLVWFAINAFGTAVATVIVLLLAEVSDDAGTKKRATARDAVKGKPSSVAEKKQATAAVSPTAVEQGDNN
ncbi:hypothetical protein TGME49_236400 [Toxoplasma gondii ME49]|uniref:Transmembrane protein n=3 Tax=Toxoplasma gondii TaxID=5811 RepID=S8EWB0_TOXGM|nr:hypothetical protein TGME49_236400 [Toxoplasma gondii ME49]EPT26667.1 hypothetical protein TGME49_236400 [Toxoplasma gondii ME49]|eukprot:XP_002369013.2 hypothetical protein TGME49_236400 [Toxoplasma gondii ME49]